MLRYNMDQYIITLYDMCGNVVNRVRVFARSKAAAKAKVANKHGWANMHVAKAG